MLDLFIKYQAKIAGLLAVIILGAIGTALWEVVFKPSSSWLLRKLLSAITLGLNRAKIKIYKRIASGQEESFAQFMSFYLVIILSCATIVSFVYLGYIYIYGFNKIYEDIRYNEHSIEEIINPSNKANLSPSEKHSIIKQDALKIRDNIKEIKNNTIILEKTFRVLFPISIIILSIWLTSLWLEYIIIIYTNSAIRYFNQLVRICAPLINESDRLQYLSEFARIKSPEEYKKLIECLKKIAENHEFDVPVFWVWGYKG